MPPGGAHRMGLAFADLEWNGSSNDTLFRPEWYNRGTKEMRCAVEWTGLIHLFESRLSVHQVQPTTQDATAVGARSRCACHTGSGFLTRDTLH